MKPLPLDQWNLINQQVIDDMGRRPLNIHGVLAHNPKLLDAWWNYRQYIVTGGTLELRHSELVVLQVAALTHTWYEWASHVDRGLKAGLSLAEINRIRDGAAADGWSIAESSLLAAVAELTNETRIAPGTLSALEEYFTQQQILDIFAIQGVYKSLACMLKTWDIDLDDDVSARLPNDVTRADFEANANVEL